MTAGPMLTAGVPGLMAAMLLLAVSCETPTVVPAESSVAESPAPVPAASSEEVAADLPVPVSAAPAPEPAVTKGTVSQMDLGKLFELQGEGRVLLVDVRPAFWHSAGHIPGSISLPLKSFDSEFPKKKAQFDAAVSDGKVIVLYCTDEECPDGRTTARKLAKEGYSTSVYTGGWKEWQASGL